MESATRRYLPGDEEGHSIFRHAQNNPPRPMSQGKMDYILFENIPKGITNIEERSSVQSLPNIPSPLSGPSPSMLSREPDQISPRMSRGRRHQGDEDTFFDDRSLEHRIQRTLGNAPRPMHLSTPASVPVTPNAHRSQQQERQQQDPNWSHPTSSHRTTTPPQQYTSQTTIKDDNLLSHQASIVILKLKRDLQNKHNDLHIVKQGAKEAEIKLLRLQKANERLEKRCLLAEEMAENLKQQGEATQKSLDETYAKLESQRIEEEKFKADRNAMETGNQQLRQQLVALRSEKQELSANIQALGEEHQDDMKTFNESTESQIERWNNELSSAFQEIERTKASLQTARSQNVELQRQLEQMSQRLGASEKEKGKVLETLHTTQEQRDQAMKELEVKEEELKSILEAKSNNTAKRKDVSCQVSFEIGPSNTMITSTKPCRTSAEESIADRLIRIRDAAERASLVKEHQREIARLKAQHEKDRQWAGKRHEQEQEDAMNVLKSQHKMAMDALKSELETKLCTREKRHREEVEKLQQELKAYASESDESLAAAMSKMNDIKHRLDREMAKRDNLQESFNELQKQLLAERKQLCTEHAENMKALKEKWENEKAALLDALQGKCNQLFEEERQCTGKRVHTGSPRSVDWGVSGLRLCGGEATHLESPMASSGLAANKTPMQEPAVSDFSFSKIDEELRETEALVHGLLGRSA